DKSFYPKGRLPFKGFEDKKSWDFNWDEVTEAIKKYGVRNGYTIVIAPTGSISMIAGCSSGIEPVYSLVFEKNVKVGSFFYMDPVFEKMMMKEGLYDDNLMKAVHDNNGSLQNIPYIPPELKRVFVTAMDIKPEDHIRALATFQKWVDSSISKTNNFPANATVEDMRQSYLLAYELGCKDVTVFRDTSIKNQVLVAPKRKEEEKKQEVAPAPPKPVEKPAEKLTTSSTTMIQKINKYDEVKNCPACTTAVNIQEGCVTCPSCGWGLCA
ncbi:ribonucleoside-diphosphate reductase, adenosylcobalamin-dependent, partial [Candidatus Micrarchaeota archaeon]|nr:ribonucleoside-diphosphate reductase, adenosylcobalamin-dependent [Candidatus Micrarchaeota archaeon]